MASLIGHGITITELRIRLEAYTLSNWGRSLQIMTIAKQLAGSQYQNSLLTTHCSLLTAHCFIQKVRSIKDGAIHVITLLRNKTTGFMVNGKRISAKVLIKKQERIGFKTCREYKSHYARIKAEYNGIPVQLFIIR